MKNEIRFMFDYQCYPIWIYNEKGEFVDNDLPDEIQQNEGITEKLNELQDEFDSLFLNNEKEFCYIGFLSDDKRESFIKKTKQVYNELCSLLKESYVVNNAINYRLL